MRIAVIAAGGTAVIIYAKSYSDDHTKQVTEAEIEKTVIVEPSPKNCPPTQARATKNQSLPHLRSLQPRLASKARVVAMAASNKT